MKSHPDCSFARPPTLPAGPPFSTVFPSSSSAYSPLHPSLSLSTCLPIYRLLHIKFTLLETAGIINMALQHEDPQFLKLLHVSSIQRHSWQIGALYFRFFSLSRVDSGFLTTSFGCRVGWINMYLFVKAPWSSLRMPYLCASQDSSQLYLSSAPPYGEAC